MVAHCRIETLQRKRSAATCGAERIPARQRLAAGESVEALHLLDVALAAEPNARDALETKLAALEALLEATGHENFSETRWLQSQIEEVRGRLAAGR